MERLFVLWSWQESNLHFSLRRGVSYPLNDKTSSALYFKALENIPYFVLLVKGFARLLATPLSFRRAPMT